MSLAFIDGAEHKLPNPPLVDGASYDCTYNGSGTIGRYGSGSVYSPLDNKNLRWMIPTPNEEMTVGMAVRQEITLQGNAFPLLGFYGAGTSILHVSVWINSDGSLSIYRGNNAGTLIGAAAAGSMVIDAWYYMEMYVKVDDAAGAFELRINGVTMDSDSGIDTRNGGADALITEIGGGRVQNGKWSLYDDIYAIVEDGSGATGFQGEISIEGLHPAGNGNYSQLVGQDGDSTNNYLNVDEAPFSATDYNGSTTVGNKDTYAYGNLAAASGAILGSVLHSGYFKFNAGFIGGRTLFRISSTDYPSSDIPSFSSSMLPLSEVFEESPATSTAWTISEVNALEAGFEVRTA